MNQKKYDKAISTFMKAKMGISLKSILKDAETAWQIQRELISLIDYKDNAVQGELKLEELIEALNMWILRLEVLEHDTKEVAKRAHQAIHERGRHVELEEDSERHRHDEDFLEVIEAFDANSEIKSSELKRSRGRNGRIRITSLTNEVGSKVINKRINKSFTKNRKVSCGEY